MNNSLSSSSITPSPRILDYQNAIVEIDESTHRDLSELASYLRLSPEELAVQIISEEMNVLPV